MAVTVTAPKKLYELSDIYFKLGNQHLAIIEEIEEAGGEATDVQLDQLTAIEDELKMCIEESQVKIVNIMRLCETRKLEIEAFKAEESRLGELSACAAAKRKRLERSNDFFEMYSLKALDEMGLEQVNDGVNTVKIRTSKRCKVINTDLVDATFIRSVTIARGSIERSDWAQLLNDFKGVEEVDKSAVKKLLNKDEPVDGCELEIHKTLKFS